MVNGLRLFSQKLLGIGMSKNLLIAHAVFALVVVLTFVGMSIKIRSLNDDLTLAQTKVRALEAEKQNFETLVKNQNAAIDKLQAEQAAKSKQATEAIKRAKKLAAQNDELAQQLLLRRPSNPDDLCASVDEVVTDYIRDRFNAYK